MGHFGVQLSQSTLTPQQVALHEASVVGHNMCSPALTIITTTLIRALHNTSALHKRRDSNPVEMVLTGHFACSATLTGHFPCSRAPMGTLMQYSCHGHFQCSAALVGTFNAVQLSWALCNGGHAALVWHFALCNSHRALLHLSKWHCMKLLWGTYTMQLSQSTDTSQQVPLHEALVGHFTIHLSQSTFTFQQVHGTVYMKLLWGTLQSNSHRALTHLSKWHCMKLL